MQRRRVLVMLTSSIVGSAALLCAGSEDDQGKQSRLEHMAWVGEVLQQMLTIKPGMTRQALLSVFTTEGGLSTRLQRTYVSRGCPYFKVDVTFQAVGHAKIDSRAPAFLYEGDDDTILTISRPYLQFSVMD